LAKRLFGTDGIRGEAGKPPLDELTVERIGRSLTHHLTAELGRLPRIVIGRDTRESGPDIEQALTRGAVALGAHVESAGVITTPGVAFLARTVPFDAGVVISASHNPFRDNGIKVFSTSGQKIADAMERGIEQDLEDWDHSAPNSTVSHSEGATNNNAAAGSGNATLSAHAYIDKYIEFLVQKVGNGLRLDGLRLGIDCANGASSKIAPAVFTQLGAEVHVQCAAPDGRNINEGCGSLHPDALATLVRKDALDIGIAFDGDADRALFVDRHGDLVDGDQTMLIIADYLRSIGRLKGNAVVTTVMSNLGLELALSERGIDTIRTNVGDRFVLEELLARGGELGGEQSGHIIFSSISLAGDGIITAIELLRAVQASGAPLGDLARKLTRYPQVLVNVPVGAKPPLESLPMVMAEMQRIESEMQGKGRLLVRYSGTENLARVMIEGADHGTIRRQADGLAALMKKEIDLLCS